MEELLHRRKILLQELKYLTWEYRDYQQYFVGRTPMEAEDRFYSKQFDDSGHDIWYEGTFSLEHVSLKERMKKNKVKRNELAKKLKELKYLIKQSNRTLNG
jgi:hypothetical protein